MAAASLRKSQGHSQQDEVTAGAVRAHHFRHIPLVGSELHLQSILEAWPQEGVTQAAGVILALPEASTTPKPTFPSSARTSDSTSKSKVDIKSGNVDIFFSTRFHRRKTSLASGYDISGAWLLQMQPFRVVSTACF